MKKFLIAGGLFLALFSCQDTAHSQDHDNQSLFYLEREVRIDSQNYMTVTHDNVRKVTCWTVTKMYGEGTGISCLHDPQ